MVKINKVVLNKEEWRDIKGYEGLYQVSNIGKIKSIYYKNKPKILKMSLTTTGYYKVELYKNKKRKSLKVHRLVGMAFIPNPKNKPNINHIDGNPLNNNVGNLEWCTQKENVIHACETGLKEIFYISKEKLNDLYTNKNKTAKDIGDLYGVSHSVIYERLNKYGIKTKGYSESKIKYSLNKQFLINELKNKTQKQVAEELGCDPSLISHYVKRIKEKGKLYA